MTARRQTRGEAAIETLLAKLDPRSERYQVLSAARDFKASWVQLGERLTLVRESGQFKEWGYATFEAYCRAELRLKPDTANKLTRSYAFLRDHSPAMLESPSDVVPQRELPPLDVVDLLSRARERAKVSDAQLATIQEEVFGGEVTPTRGEVLKRFREVDPDAFRAAPRAAPAVEKTGGSEELRKALLLAERLQSLLESHADVSRSAQANIRSIVAELKKLFEATRAA